MDAHSPETRPRGSEASNLRTAAGSDAAALCLVEQVAASCRCTRSPTRNLYPSGDAHVLLAAWSETFPGSGSPWGALSRPLRLPGFLPAPAQYSPADPPSCREDAGSPKWPGALGSCRRVWTPRSGPSARATSGKVRGATDWAVAREIGVGLGARFLVCASVVFCGWVSPDLDPLNTGLRFLCLGSRRPEPGSGTRPGWCREMQTEPEVNLPSLDATLHSGKSCLTRTERKTL